MPEAVRTSRKHLQTASRERPFIPVLSFPVLRPLYNLLTEMLGLGVPFTLRLVEAMEIPRGGTVLDVGTGTGLLPILLIEARPDLCVVGLDSDLAILKQAKRNAVRAGAHPTFKQGVAERLPYPDRHFDTVVCSLTLHHLSAGAKRAACHEMARVLRRGAWCYVADFAPPHTRWARLVTIVARLICPAHIGDNLQGQIPRFLEAAGFVNIDEVFQTPWSVSVYRARRAPDGGATARDRPPAGTLEPWLSVSEAACPLDHLVESGGQRTGTATAELPKKLEVVGSRLNPARRDGRGQAGRSVRALG